MQNDRHCRAATCRCAHMDAAPAGACMQGQHAVFRENCPKPSDRNHAVLAPACMTTCRLKPRPATCLQGDRQLPCQVLVSQQDDADSATNTIPRRIQVPRAHTPYPNLNWNQRDLTCVCGAQVPISISLAMGSELHGGTLHKSCAEALYVRDDLSAARSCLQAALAHLQSSCVCTYALYSTCSQN